MTRRMRAGEVKPDDLFQLDDGAWGEVLVVSAPPADSGFERLVFTYRRLADPPGEGRTLRLSADDTLVVSTPDATVAAAENT